MNKSSREKMLKFRAFGAINLIVAKFLPKFLAKLKALSSINLALMCFILFMMLGCANSVTAYYNTIQDNTNKIDKNISVSVFVPENSSVEEKEFARVLSNKLSNNGFKINDKSNCVFVFTLDEPTYKNIGSSIDYVPSTTTTNVSGFVGNTYVYGSGSSQTLTPQTRHYTYSTTYKKIYLDYACLDSNNKIEKNWQGFASTEISNYKQYSEKMIENLATLVGETYTGDLSIEPIKKRETICL